VRWGTLRRKCTCGGTPGPSQECGDCHRRRLSLRRSALGPEKAAIAPPIVHEVLCSPGKPLDAVTRALMEPRFGHDFSQVRVHSDSQAAEAARSVDALAFAVGKHLVFNSNQYSPNTDPGYRLIAHELTHVVQQSGTNGNCVPSKPILGAPNDGSEREADRVMEQITRPPVQDPGRRIVIRVADITSSVRRYGHATSCKDDAHLKPYVWPGHDEAKKATDRATNETNKRPLTKTAELRNFFGKSAATEVNLTAINENFRKIRQALDQQYLYHCVEKDSKDSDALPCVGNNARTNESGKNHDVTLCFDQKRFWGTPEALGAAWLIIHENVHRGLDLWPKTHLWAPAGGLDGCGGDTSVISQSELVLDNPDSYSCFALMM
jgi:hypothetical protein